MRDPAPARCVLNIACAYTARAELTAAVNAHAGRALQDSLYTLPTSDMLVRTSGEVRLSNFLLWQLTHGAQLCFVRALWPEFTFYRFCLALLGFQCKRVLFN